MAIHLFIHSVCTIQNGQTVCVCVHVQVNQDSRGNPVVTVIVAAMQHGSCSCELATLTNIHLLFHIINCRLPVTLASSLYSTLLYVQAQCLPNIYSKCAQVITKFQRKIKI